METKKIFIIGFEETFDIACAITQTVARGNHDVTLRFTDETACNNALEKIRSELSSDDKSVMDHIQTTTDLNSAQSADIVIESVFMCFCI